MTGINTWESERRKQGGVGGAELRAHKAMTALCRAWSKYCPSANQIRLKQPGVHTPVLLGHHKGRPETGRPRKELIACDCHCTAVSSTVSLLLIFCLCRSLPSISTFIPLVPALCHNPNSTGIFWFFPYSRNFLIAIFIRADSLSLYLLFSHKSQLL